MKKTKKSAMLLAMAALARPAVPAAASAQTSAQVWHIEGAKAHYDAFEVSADRCRYHRLALDVVQNAQRDGATTGSQTVVSGLYLSADFCDPAGKVGTLLDAYAQPLPSSALTFDRDLSTVRLKGRVDFSDDVAAPVEFGGGGPAATVPLDVDVIWSATGDPVHFEGGDRFHGERCGYTEHATGSFRRATMAGTVTDASGLSYLPSRPASTDAGVEKVDDGIIQVGCPGAAAARASQAVAASTPSSVTSAYTVAAQGSLAVAGLQAMAVWSRMDPDGCHRTSFGLILSDETVRDTGAPVESPNVDGFGAIDDLCHPGQGADAIFGFGYGGEAVAPGSIVIDRQLGSASAHFTVTGTMETIDSFESVPVTIDIEWTGTGDMVRSTGGYRFRLAEPASTGCAYISTGTATQRAAAATGAVTFGQTAAAAGAAGWALLQDVRQGQQGDVCS